MSDISNLSNTIIPKSDQLNADDMLTGPITVTITAVKAGDKDQPVVIHIECRPPYKPCKSMRRVLITAWGEDGRAWIGRAMTLYCDPDVMWGGVKVGGIRISHLSHIDNDLNMALTATRGNKKQFKVSKLTASQPALYDDGKFNSNIAAWSDAITSGKLTGEQVISRAEKSGGKLTDEMLAKILAVKKIENDDDVAI